MKVLLVGPEICAPYTEGRKRFVLDVAHALGANHEVKLCTTRLAHSEWRRDLKIVRAPICDTGASHLFSLWVASAKAIREFKPDFVLHFPYGSFKGIRGVANDLAIKAVAFNAKAQSVPCSTVLYALDSARSPRTMQQRHDNLVIVGDAAHSLSPLNLAIDTSGWPKLQPTHKRPNTVLFMAGMWQPTAERLEHVLEVRGLAQFLRIGTQLAASRIRGIAACPLFRHQELRDAVLADPRNTWPDGTLQLLGEVETPQIFDQCRLFVFPYQQALSAFTPSSIAEAMLAETPVIVSDQDFLKPIANYIPLFQAQFVSTDANALSALVKKLLSRHVQISSQAASFAQHHWSMESLGSNLENLLKILYVKPRNG